MEKKNSEPLCGGCCDQGHRGMTYRNILIQPNLILSEGVEKVSSNFVAGLRIFNVQHACVLH